MRRRVGLTFQILISMRMMSEAFTIAEWNNQVIGTVRVFPVDNSGHWIGGRLAVRKEFSYLARARISN